jgi:proteasome alpha subunit
VRMADLNGLSFDRRDVTSLALANGYAQTLGAIFTEQSKPFEVELCVAEVGATPDDDEIYRLTYDGSVNAEPGCMAMGGQADAIAGKLRDGHRRDMPLADAVKLAVKSLGSVGGEGGADRTIAANQLEVAILDRRRVGRTFRRIIGPALAALLEDSPAPAADTDAAPAADAEAGKPAAAPSGAKPPTGTAKKPTSSAGSADLEDKPAQAEDAKPAKPANGTKPGDGEKPAG